MIQTDELYSNYLEGTHLSDVLCYTMIRVSFNYDFPDSEVNHTNRSRDFLVARQEIKFWISEHTSNTAILEAVWIFICNPSSKSASPQSYGGNQIYSDIKRNLSHRYSEDTVKHALNTLQTAIAKFLQDRSYEVLLKDLYESVRSEGINSLSNWFEGHIQQEEMVQKSLEIIAEYIQSVQGDPSWWELEELVTNDMNEIKSHIEEEIGIDFKNLIRLGIIHELTWVKSNKTTELVLKIPEYVFEYIQSLCDQKNDARIDKTPFEIEVHRSLESAQPIMLDALSLWSINPTSKTAGYGVEENKGYLFNALEKRYPNKDIEHIMSQLEEIIQTLQKTPNDSSHLSSLPNIDDIREALLKDIYRKHLDSLVQNGVSLFSKISNQEELDLLRSFKTVLQNRNILNYIPKPSTLFFDWYEQFYYIADIEEEYWTRHNKNPHNLDLLSELGLLTLMYYKPSRGKERTSYVIQHHIPLVLANLQIPDQFLKSEEVNQKYELSVLEILNEYKDNLEMVEGLSAWAINPTLANVGYGISENKENLFNALEGRFGKDKASELTENINTVTTRLIAHGEKLQMRKTVVGVLRKAILQWVADEKNDTMESLLCERVKESIDLHPALYSYYLALKSADSNLEVSYTTSKQIHKMYYLTFGKKTKTKLIDILTELGAAIEYDLVDQTRKSKRVVCPHVWTKKLLTTQNDLFSINEQVSIQPDFKEFETRLSSWSMFQKLFISKLLEKPLGMGLGDNGLREISELSGSHAIQEIPGVIMHYDDEYYINPLHRDKIHQIWEEFNRNQLGAIVSDINFALENVSNELEMSGSYQEIAYNSVLGSYVGNFNSRTEGAAKLFVMDYFTPNSVTNLSKSDSVLISCESNVPNLQKKLTKFISDGGLSSKSFSSITYDGESVNVVIQGNLKFVNRLVEALEGIIEIRRHRSSEEISCAGFGDSSVGVENRESVFTQIHIAEFQTDKPTSVFSEIRSLAKKIFWIVDPYINQAILWKLVELPRTVTDVRILTTMEAYKESDWIRLDAVKEWLEEHHKKVPNLRIKSADYRKLHDRRIFVDDHSWILTTSLKEIASQKSSDIIHTLPCVSEKHRNEFLRIWKKSSPFYFGPKVKKMRRESIEEREI